jgi:hypothetical protein
MVPVCPPSAAAAACLPMVFSPQTSADRGVGQGKTRHSKECALEERRIAVFAVGDAWARLFSEVCVSPKGAAVCASLEVDPEPARAEMACWDNTSAIQFIVFFNRKWILIFLRAEEGHAVAV